MIQAPSALNPNMAGSYNAVKIDIINPTAGAPAQYAAPSAPYYFNYPQAQIYPQTPAQTEPEAKVTA